MTDDWFIEKHTPHAGLSLAIRERLLDEQTPFQRIEVLDTHEFGRMMLLDGCVMFTDRDEFVYHEMIVHVPMLTHPAPKDVLIIGGGDGGSVREALKHPGVESVQLVEIDEGVINASRKYFPALVTGLDDPRVSIQCMDGFQFLDDHQDAFDVILVDSIDPVGEAAKLFTTSFYAKVKASLRAGGCAAFQSESPFYSTSVLAEMQQRLGEGFKVVRPYTAFIPTYPSGLWSFTFTSDSMDPLQRFPERMPPHLDGLRYLNAGVFRAAFALPNYIREGLGL